MSHATKPAHSVTAATPVAPRSQLRWIPNWLRPGWSRLLGHRPRLAVKRRPVALRDGSKVLIRQVQPADAPLLAAGFARLSPESRRMRFLARKDQLSAAELRYFTELDHHDHEALGAVSQADGRGVGVVRYVRDGDDPQAAEIALTIVDDWQGRGLGTELLTRLSGRARSEGICRFTALVADDNVAMAGLLRNMSANLVGRSPGTVEYEITLMPPGKNTTTPAAGLRPDRVRTPC
jgi:RimJ/RimL family protein N-acetyltransferase